MNPSAEKDPGVQPCDTLPPDHFDSMIKLVPTRNATAIFADLHMSDRSAGDDFLRNEYFFWKTLDWLASIGIQNLVLAGDTYDLWEAPGSAIWQKYMRLILNMHQLFNVIYVVGNHDPREKLEGMDELVSPLMTIQSKHLIFAPKECPGAHRYPIKIVHGHEFDPLISRFPRIAGVVARLGGVLERRGFSKVDMLFHRVFQRLERTGRYSVDTRFSDIVFQNTLETEDIDLCARPTTLICGHTHRTSFKWKDIYSVEDSKPRKRFFYLNPGSWVGINQPLNFLIADENGIQLYAAMYAKHYRKPIIIASC